MAIDNEPPEDGETIVIYSDIEPDFVSNNLSTSFELDVNQDSIVDLNIYYDIEGNTLLIGSRSYLSGVLSLTDWGTYTVPLDEGRKIPDEFKNGELFSSSSYFSIEAWGYQVDKYLGVRIYIKDKFHYGWVRLQFESDTSWVIKDYAYNATPDTPILAGQKE
ncbi:hypothetical protein E7Z59_13135 [Robertkochia marina]|uniref:Uncharacterized protein n=1 Tax=Robertkochia marina TaxID=1227945 RepID=A0A4S3LZV0_9FLAO|nr:hypothetical protein [Robertkochia marina]THD66721.1 hypothetical protein E7Z59_13135 [Robertkochia marina]